MNSISTLAVRDFILHFRPQTSDAEQVRFGRVAIAGAMILGAGDAAVIAWQPQGIYKYLQTMSIYLTMPLIPAIAFGILSKRVTFAGAAASFFIGIVLAAIYVVDELIPDKDMAANTQAADRIPCRPDVRDCHRPGPPRRFCGGCARD